MMLFIAGECLKSQIVVNDKLMTQLTANQAIRLASEERFQKLYEKQKKIYEDANKKITQIIAIQEYIYRQLTNVNETILQGKKVKYMYKYMESIMKHADELQKLTREYPEYAVLSYKFYEIIIRETLNIKTEIENTALKEGKDVLIDTKDRAEMIDRIYMKLQQIRGAIILINMRIKDAKRKPYIYQIPKLQNWVSSDKVIVNDVIRKWGYLKKW